MPEPFIPKWDHKFKWKEGTWIHVPSKESRRLGRDLIKKLQKLWKCPPYFFHLTDGGHTAALKSHLNDTCFAKIDLKGFFNSINLSRVTRELNRYFPYSQARAFAKHSTVLLPNISRKTIVLPYGFVQSPLLASICLDHSSAGSTLKELHKTPGLNISVYVDDIVLSSQDPAILRTAWDKLIASINKSKFQINELKSSAPSTEIQAFNITLTHKSLCISPERLEQLREGYQTTESEYTRRGIMTYVLSVNPDQFSDFN